MKFETNKEKGNSGLAIVIAYYVNNINSIENIKNKAILNLCDKYIKFKVK